MQNPRLPGFPFMGRFRGLLVADPGEGPGGPKIFFFGERPPAPLRYLRVWITAPSLSEGLDLRYLFERSPFRLKTTIYFL